MVGGFLWSVKNSLLALYISLLLIGCAEPSVLSESEISDKSEDSDSAEAIDLDDKETLERILAEASRLQADLDSRAEEIGRLLCKGQTHFFGRFGNPMAITGSLFYYSPNDLLLNFTTPSESPTRLLKEENQSVFGLGQFGYFPYSSDQWQGMPSGSIHGWQGKRYLGGVVLRRTARISWHYQGRHEERRSIYFSPGFLGLDFGSRTDKGDRMPFVHANYLIQALLWDEQEGRTFDGLVQKRAEEIGRELCQ